MTLVLRRIGLGLALLLVAFAAMPALASARGGGRGSQIAAERALQKVKDLKQGIGVHTGRELTPALADLALRQGALDARGRKAAAALLARPTDANEGSPGHAYSTTEATPRCGTNFCIHYVTTTVDAPVLTDASPANGVPDFVDNTLSVFEDEVFPCENGTAALGCAGAPTGLGWPQAPSDGTKGGNAKFDVYLEQLGTSGVFGYAAPETAVTPSAYSSYMVLDDDFAQAEYGYADPLLPLRVTAAHEYNHVLQFGIDPIEDQWMFESTATWAEDKVYPAINDYLNYMPDWVQLLSQPLTEFASDKNNTTVREDLKVYGSAVWNHFLSERYGDDTILNAWQAKTQDPGNNGSLAPASYSTALAGDGTNFASEFDDFAAATAEWNHSNTDFPDVYPDIPASQRPNMAINAAAATIALDHTTFAFRNIAPPGTPTALTLTATLPAGLDGAVAMVGRATGGTVTKVVQRTTSGGTLTAVLPAGSYARVTAILVNADTSTNNFGGSDWNWTADNKSFTSVRVTSGPQPTTGTASSISLTGATLNGSANPNGAATDAWFEYGTTTAYGSETTHTPIGSGTSAVAQAVPITGLTRGTTYHFRMVASNGTITNTGADQTFTTLDPPVVTTGVADPIAATGATLNGTVDPNGKATTYWFEYGTTTGYGSESTHSSGGSGTSALAQTAAITGLTQGTQYHFRIVAQNADGTTQGSDQTFTTKDPPIVTTDAASGITGTGATLNGTVDDRGHAATYKFQYGTTTGYGTESTGGPVAGAAVSDTISGLAPGTVYHFRVVATSSEGVTNGGDQTFTTPGPPIVATSAASAVGLTGATLNATVNPTGLDTDYHFEYGLDTNYGTPTPSASAGNGGTAVAESVPITGLTRGTTYHYRVVATNAGGTVHGNDMTFTTLDPPVATTGGTSAITSSGASVGGTVDPNGKATTFRFEFGTSTAYGSEVTGTAGSGSTPVSVVGALTGLSPSTTYHYRLVATNADGSAAGGDATFTTAAAPPPATNTQNPVPTPPSDQPITTIQRQLLKLTLAVVPVKLRTALAKGLRVKGTCSATCALTVKLVLSAKDAKRLRLKTTVATVKGRGGTSLKLRVSKKNARKLAQLKRIRVKLVVAAVGTDGQKVSLSKPLTLKR